MNTPKLNNLLVFALVMLFSFTAAAQDYTFKVISKKGSAQVGGNELKVGSKIKSGQSIIVGASTLLNIAHNNGKSLNISKSGTYKVDDLAKGCTAQGNSLASKYADFVLKELTSGDDNGVRGKNMRKPGSVVRGEDEATLLFATPGKKMAAAPGKVTLKCFLNDGDKARYKFAPDEITKYTFVIGDFMNKEIERIDTDKPTLTIDLNSEKYAEVKGAITYYAFVNDNPEARSLGFALELVKGAEAKKIVEDATVLEEDGSALSQLILARFFEEKGLHANALHAYEKALQISDNNTMYNEMYQAFLDRNYMSKKSKKKTN